MGGCIYLRYRKKEVEIQYVNLPVRYKHYNNIEYCHSSVNLGYVLDALYLENGNVHVYRPVLKYKTATMFFFSKTFSSFKSFRLKSKHIITQILSSVLGI